MLTRHINQQLEWERCTHERRRRGGNVWRTAAEGMSVDECGGEQAISSAIHCSYALYPPFFLHAYSSFPPPPHSVWLYSSSPHVTSISDWRCVFSNPTFYPIISPPGLSGWCSQALSASCLGSFDHRTHLRVWLLPLLLLPGRSHAHQLSKLGESLGKRCLGVKSPDMFRPT